MKLTPNQKRALRHLWKGELTMEEIAEEMNFTAFELSEAVRLMNLPDRVEPDIYIPTREEILLEAAKIRAKWTPAEREARRCAAWSARLDIATGLDTNARRRSAHRKSDGGEAPRQA